MGRQYSGGSLSQIDGMRGYGAVYGQNNPEQFSIRYLDGNEDLLQEGWKQMTDPISGKQIVFKDYGTTLRDEVYKDCLLYTSVRMLPETNDGMRRFLSNIQDI